MINNRNGNIIYTNLDQNHAPNTPTSNDLASTTFLRKTKETNKDTQTQTSKKESSPPLSNASIYKDNA